MLLPPTWKGSAHVRLMRKALQDLGITERERLTSWLGLNVKGNATLRKTSNVVTTGAILLLSL